MLFYLFALVQALLLLSHMSPEIVGEKIEINRIYEAVDFLLPFQVQNTYTCHFDIFKFEVQLDK